MKIAIYWFRRDLRINDNSALNKALGSAYPVLPLFIFDDNILQDLPPDDSRVQFIYDSLSGIHQVLRAKNSGVLCQKGDPLATWATLLNTYDIAEVYINRDYEPYARNRDEQLEKLLKKHEVKLITCKDHVIFEAHEVLKADETPYTVYTPYKNKWLQKFSNESKDCEPKPMIKGRFLEHQTTWPALEALGMNRSPILVKDYDLNVLNQYAENRDYPVFSTSHIGPHLRFGTISIRQVVATLDIQKDAVFLSELIWREFFTQILWHFPSVQSQNFKSKYDGIAWRNKPEEFDKWCKGETGYPLVDAGMRELNHTGFMHNRVRMVTAAFLCKHLLIHWSWGEAYFAEKLHDYELASNNGNWQWAAGTGCDAAPYFRIFNPEAQLKKFDSRESYVRKWLPEYGTEYYPKPMVLHSFARQRALNVYKEGLARNFTA